MQDENQPSVPQNNSETNLEQVQPSLPIAIVLAILFPGFAFYYVGLSFVPSALAGYFY